VAAEKKVPPLADLNARSIEMLDKMGPDARPRNQRDAKGTAKTIQRHSLPPKAAPMTARLARRRIAHRLRRFRPLSQVVHWSAAFQAARFPAAWKAAAPSAQ